MEAEGRKLERELLELKSSLLARRVMRELAELGTRPGSSVGGLKGVAEVDATGCAETVRTRRENSEFSILGRGEERGEPGPSRRAREGGKFKRGELRSWAMHVRRRRFTESPRPVRIGRTNETVQTKEQNKNFSFNNSRNSPLRARPYS